MAGDRSHGATRRPILAGLLALALLAVVALASRGHVPGGGGGSARHVNGRLVLEYAMVILAAYALVVVPLTVYWIYRNRREAPLRERRKWMLRTLFVFALFAATAALIMRSDGLRHWLSSHHRHPRQPPAATGTAHASSQAGKDFDWAPVIVVGSIFMIGSGLAWFFLFRRPPRRTADDLAAQFADVLDDTLEDLRNEPDARRAVIAAYARMERALAWFGLPRRIFEAPLEYLGRVLVDLHASSESVRRLTGLFERAKFSAHEIGPPLKHDAIEALVTVRDELRSYR